jgi:hypothetical protein
MITEVEKSLEVLQGQSGEVAERKREWAKSLQEGRKYGDDGHPRQSGSSPIISCHRRRVISGIPVSLWMCGIRPRT